jgi:hypothetical protein
LKEGDKYQTKPELGGELVKELSQQGFQIKRVLADSFYGESRSNFLRVMEELGIEYAVAIRSDHGVWLPQEQKVRANKWIKFEHTRWDGQAEIRYIREIIFGKRRSLQYGEITTDKETLPEASNWLVMTRIPQVKYHEVGDIYGVRTWIEYGFKQCKHELGWADFRVTRYEQIQKWWELVMSAYLMICLHNESLNSCLNPVPERFQHHERWSPKNGWKNLLNNLQLILQPFSQFNLILKWLKIFPIPQFSLEFPRLIAQMNKFDCLQYLVYSISRISEVHFTPASCLLPQTRISVPHLNENCYIFGTTFTALLTRVMKEGYSTEPSAVVNFSLARTFS